MCVPTFRSHLEVVHIRFTNEFDIKEIHDKLDGAVGIVIEDDHTTNNFPEPIKTSDKDDISVGRIRHAYNGDIRSVQLILSGYQLRKGAAFECYSNY